MAARHRGARPSGLGRGPRLRLSGRDRGAPRIATTLEGLQVACRSDAQPTCGTSRLGGNAGFPDKEGSGADGTPDPDRLDPVLTHRLDPQRVAVGLDRVTALRKPPELAEDIA